MSYLLSYLINRMEDVKIRIKQLEHLKEKCVSKAYYIKLEDELCHQRSLLEELIVIYQLALEE